MNTKIKFVHAIVSACLCLSACGGGGSGDTTATGVPRPNYNTGTGFFIPAGSKQIADASGMQFIPRGVNRLHWDNDSLSSVAAMNANVERIVLDLTQSDATNSALLAGLIGKKIVPMPGNWDATGLTDAASLSAVVDTWVAKAALMKPFEKYSIVNIANEWGPADSVVWRDSYITAIARMRAAGYLGTLSITSGGFGQDMADLVNYAQAVFDSDPQKNVIFDLHVYGGFATGGESWQQDWASSVTQLAALKVPVIFGEFGPGQNIGPSPTMLTPDTIIAGAEANGFGWMAWAVDDNNEADCTSNNWFALLANTCMPYPPASNLTAFGVDIVAKLQALAIKAKAFGA